MNNIELRNYKEFAMLYNKMVSECFTRCITTFNERRLSSDESSWRLAHMLTKKSEWEVLLHLYLPDDHDYYGKLQKKDLCCDENNSITFDIPTVLIKDKTSESSSHRKTTDSAEVFLEYIIKQNYKITFLCAQYQRIYRECDVRGSKSLNLKCTHPSQVESTMEVDEICQNISFKKFKT